jgi:molybdopterin-guanine dinucleotide biosynthesis protein A
LHAPQAAWLVIACDMPALDAATLQLLIDGRDSHSPATALASGPRGEPEPLCAIYEPATLAAFHAQVIAGGTVSPRDWLAAGRARLLRVADETVLASANTRGELATLREQLESRGVPDRKPK